MMIVQMRKILNAFFLKFAQGGLPASGVRSNEKNLTYHFFLIFATGVSPASGGRSNENRHAEISIGACRPLAASRHKSRCGLKSKDSKKALKC